MAKFIIECPKCGAYQEASTGFFSKKTLECKCGALIDVKKDRFTIKECPHCKNHVLCDQAKQSKAICPVCGKKLVTEETKSNFTNITCSGCSCDIQVNKSAKSIVCPLCSKEIDVQKALAQIKAREGDEPKVIKYEGPNNIIIWKHPIEDFTLGTQLIVHESQEAIFFRDGQALDSFSAGRYTLSTQKIPLLDNLYKLPLDKDKVYHSEIYFINMVTYTSIKWGTDTKVRMFDPASGLSLELGAYGEFNIKVTNARKLLIKLVGTADSLNLSEVLDANYDATKFTGKFKGLIIAKVKNILAKTIRENGINILEVDEHMELLSQSMKEEINKVLDQYGLTMPEFFVLKVITPDDDPNFRKMKEQYAEQYLLVRDEQIKKNVAMAEQERKLVEANTRSQEEIIEAKGKAEAYRLQAEAEAEEMKMKGYTYQDETRRQVSTTWAENMPLAGSGAADGASGVVSNIVGLGVTMGAVGQVMDMTKEAMSPVMQSAKTMSSSMASTDSWKCSCGQENITSNFCPVCGSKKPQASDLWTCPSCGKTNISSKFCPECGAKKKELESWDCTCGKKGITSKFCPECGSKKVEVETWDCTCGKKGITSKFCPECGSKKVEVETWDCECGKKGIATSFCPECGSKKPTETTWDCECGEIGITTAFCPACGSKKGE